MGGSCSIGEQMNKGTRNMGSALLIIALVSYEGPQWSEVMRRSGFYEAADSKFCGHKIDGMYPWCCVCNYQVRDGRSILKWWQCCWSSVVGLSVGFCCRRGWMLLFSTCGVKILGVWCGC